MMSTRFKDSEKLELYYEWQKGVDIQLFWERFGTKYKRQHKSGLIFQGKKNSKL